jgi:hypothetical protein
LRGPVAGSISQDHEAARKIVPAVTEEGLLQALHQQTPGHADLPVSRIALPTIPRPAQVASSGHNSISKMLAGGVGVGEAGHLGSYWL